jgi:transposase InsO family protein
LGHRPARAEEHKTRQAGKTVVIGVLDDPTRLTCCELHAEENAVTVTATLRRTASWFREQGCLPLETVMSDNHEAYTSTAFTSLLAELGTRQIAHPPTRRAGTRSSASSAPRREWSHSRTWPNSTARDRALASFMRFYNRRRPHSAANRRTPITRVQQVREQDG